MNAPYLFMVLATVVLGSEALQWWRERRLPSAGPDDAATAPLITLAAAVGVVCAFFTRGWSGLPHSTRWGAVVLVLLGVALRRWAIASLGAHFTLGLRVAPDQVVVDRGPYRFIRHPAYLGGQLALLGLGLSVGNLAAAFALWLPMFGAHLRRMHIEERLLVQRLGAPYVSYCARTARLVPGVF